MLFFLFIIKFFGHFYESLRSCSLAVCQESSPRKGTLLPVCRIEVVYEQVTGEVLADTAMLDSTCRTSVKFALSPEELSVLVAAS